MDVDKTSFYPLLLDILTDISQSLFVAIDLELSGVPVKDSWSKSAGKQTLQERYLEIRDAANKYQILQIGLTCIEQNVEEGSYVLKPYNFDLCPILGERLDIEREFSFSSSAAEFLLKVGFDMNRPFGRGVPYLSRIESKLAREKYETRQDKTALAVINLTPTETESLAFLDRVRGEIKSWNESKKISTPNYLNIAPVGYDTMDGQQQMTDLTRYEKRLVHQLVREEFPKLVTMSKKGFIQIIKFDQQREEKIAESKKREHSERVARQKGFRWIIEAMLGNNISGIDLRECAKDGVTGAPIFYDQDDYKAQYHRAQALLKGCPRILVGHNCFLDFVYIYRTFIGDLPNTVEEFQKKLHKLWPVIVDTKYMSTHNCGDISPASSLEQIALQLSNLATPKVATDGQHTKYNNRTAYHEAGYDSYLTAQVAVRLSAKLEREGAYINVEEGDSIRPYDISNGTGPKKSTEAVDKEQRASSKTNGHGKNEETSFTPSIPGGKWKRRGDPTIGMAAKDDPFSYDPKDLRHRHHKHEETIPNGMPGFSSDFWRVYGNKFRVFGTQEEICVLDSANESPSDDGGVTLESDTNDVAPEEPQQYKLMEELGQVSLH